MILVCIIIYLCFYIYDLLGIDVIEPVDDFSLIHLQHVPVATPKVEVAVS